MATAFELKSFSDKTSFDVPTIDYAVGVPSGVILKDFTKVGTSIPGVIYNPTTKMLRIQSDGVTLSGYNFSGVTVSVEANNVTLKNSYFDASAGVYSVTQAVGKTGLVIYHSTFDGLKLNKPLADFINGGTGAVNITYNTFLNAPSDAIQFKQGVIDHNYFSGGGYQSGAHADAISIDGATGKIVITNNFIDYRNAPDALAATTSAIAIGNYFGNNQDITVTKNILLGGAYTIYVQDFGKYTYSQVDITNNYIGGALYGDLYPNRQPASLNYELNGKLITGLTSSVSAQNVDVAAVAAPVVVGPVSDIGQKVFGKAGVIETLTGTSGTDWIYSNGGGDKLVGGGGRDFLFGGKGTDIFVFKTVTDSAVGKNDVIANFTAGDDKIDLHGLSGLGKLSFIGDKAFGGVAGSVRAVKSADSTWVEADTNGDRTAELRVELKGLHNLSAIDFIL